MDGHPNAVRTVSQLAAIHAGWPTAAERGDHRGVREQRHRQSLSSQLPGEDTNDEWIQRLQLPARAAAADRRPTYTPRRAG